MAGSPAAHMAEARALLHFSSMHGQGELDMAAFSANVRATLRDSLDRSLSAVLDDARAASLPGTGRTAQVMAGLYLVHVQAGVHLAGFSVALSCTVPKVWQDVELGSLCSCFLFGSLVVWLCVVRTV
jgi:hypothetical protein